MTSATWKIYVLHNESGAFYVGASQNFELRLRKHKQTFKPAFEWTILEECRSDWRDREHFWITKYRDEGAVLHNKTAGRNGHEALSDETKAKLSKAKKGKPKPDGFGERVSATLRGQPRGWSPEGELRVRSTQFKKGHKSKAGGFRDPANWTPEKRSAAAKKSRVTFYANCSEERRKQIGARVAASRLANGYKPSEETKAKMAAASRGRLHSEETKAGMSARRREWWTRKRMMAV